MNLFTRIGIVGYAFGVFLLFWSLLLGFSGGNDSGAMVKALLSIGFFAASSTSIMIAWYIAWLQSQTRR